MNIHRCPVCNGSGEALSAPVQGIKKGQWGWFRQVICTLCYGTGQVSEELARRIIINEDGSVTMKQQIEFADDVLIIDELEDGETYHVTIPNLGVDKLTKDPNTNAYIPTQDDIDKIQNEINDQLKEVDDKVRYRDALQEKRQNALSLAPFQNKMQAAIRLITADTSVYHRFWGEVRTVSVDKDGNVFFGPRAMSRERPEEE